MTYDWSSYPDEIAITWKYHGLVFGKSLSQLEALEVLEQGEELRSSTSRNIVWLNQIIVKAIIATVHGNVQDVQCGELKWKLQPWNWQIRKSGAKFAAAMWNSGQMIHSEHSSHFSVGLFGGEQLLTNSYWQRQLQKNDTVEVASEKEGFLLALTKFCSKWLKFRLVQLLLKRVHPKLRSPFWTDGL